MVSPAKTLSTHITSVRSELKVDRIDMPLDLSLYPPVTNGTVTGLVVSDWKGIHVS